MKSPKFTPQNQAPSKEPTYAYAKTGEPEISKTTAQSILDLGYTRLMLKSMTVAEIQDKINKQQTCKRPEIKDPLALYNEELKKKNKNINTPPSDKNEQKNTNENVIIGALDRGTLENNVKKYVSHLGLDKHMAYLSKTYGNCFENIECMKLVIRNFFSKTYYSYREGKYQSNQDEDIKIWNKYISSTNISVSPQNNWMYRGSFPKPGEKTITRGSFNVKVTPEVIEGLDAMILSGKIKANYKFGDPETGASSSGRHDSITIYFLEQPADKVLQELAVLVKPYVRGDNLIGKKIGDGFFMSEIGSIETKQIEELVENLKTKDPLFSEAIKDYVRPTGIDSMPGYGKNGKLIPPKNTALKMSEAQFYAVKDTAKVFGYDLSFDAKTGFKITNIV